MEIIDVKQELLNEILKIGQLQNQLYEQTLINGITDLFNGKEFANYKVNIHKNTIYEVDNNCIVAKCKAKDTEELLVILIKLIIDQYVWDEICYEFSDAYFVDYDEQIEKIELSLKQNMINQLSDTYKQRVNEDFNKRFERYTDSELYKQWLNE